MLSNKPKSYSFFLIITLIIVGLVSYLGFRTIEHQALLKRYQTEQQGQSYINQADKFVTQLLQQKTSHLQTIANYLTVTDSAIKELINKETNIDNIFILQNNKLIYPQQQTALTQKEQQLITDITPIIEDVNLLYAPNIQNEKTKPSAGWYINYNSQIPLLIYWQQKNDLTIGFQLSYMQLLSDVINNANFTDNNGNLKIIENDRVLYQSNAFLSDSKLIATQYLNYPLTNWQINYYGQATDVIAIYLWGLFFVLLLLMIIGLIMFRLYREYTHTARQALQQVNFVSQVSHELKTPLTNITLYAELLKEQQEEQQEEGLHHIEVIISESQRLSRLIQNILSFTQTPKLHFTIFNLSEVLTQIGQTFSPSFNSKGLQLVLDIPQQIMINSDKDKVMQIICNFLSNAEKYAVQGKQVDLTVQQQADSIDIQVRDYGKGIPHKEQKLIFQPFYRIKSIITEGVAGTGIGLTIARQLAHSLQGEILITNTNPGVCFTLRLWQSPHEEATDNNL